MSALTAIKTWSFASVSFARAISGEVPAWFGSEAQHTADAILGSDERYVDIGAIVAGPLAVRMVTDSSSDHAALLAELGETGTLSNGKGSSADVLMSKAQAVFLPVPGFYFIDAEFVELS